jgi:pimeloyl-ACP methyl ester carboxylesterase
LARESGAGAIADSMLPKMLTPATIASAPELAARVQELMAATPVAGIVGALAAMRDRPDSTELLPTLEGIPTLVIVGQADQVTPPADARRLTDAIPGATLVEVPGAAHLVSVEKSEEVTGLLREFLRRF